MIVGRVTLGPPLDDRKVVQLDRMLTDLFTRGLQARTATYTGTGMAQTITIGFKAQLVYIQKVKANDRDATPTGNAAIILREAGGVAYVFGSGYATDVVTAFTADTLTLGTNSAVNASAITYRYFAIG